MDKQQWKYIISDGYTGTILAFFLFLTFAGLSCWMKKMDNEVFPIAVILTIVMFLAFAAAFYRASFHKVLVGKDGLYYQSGIGRGAYYPYTQMNNAWTSSGQALNGYNHHYCNFETVEGQVIRFTYFPTSEKAVKYILRRYKAVGGAKTDSVKDTHEYQITGKFLGKSAIVICLIVLIVVIAIDMVDTKYGTMGRWIFLIVAALIYLIVDYFCFKVWIGTDGFYCRTTPFNGQYYSYSEIVDCEEVRKAYRHGVGADSPIYYFYFRFTDRNGKTRRFQFEKPIYEHEINVLKMRIEEAVADKQSVE